MNTLRPAHAGEYPVFLALMRTEMIDYLDDGLGHLGLSWESYAQLFRTRGRVSALEVDGAEAGFCWTELRDEVLHLHALVVRPEFRGRGLARWLLELLASGFAPSAREIELGVHASNAAARRLYDAAGFRVVREIPELAFDVMRKTIRG